MNGPAPNGRVGCQPLAAAAISFSIGAKMGLANRS